VTLVEANTRFIEAFMVGLNHEMGRELLWREYPTDLRGTFFRLFWDQRGVPEGSPSLALSPLRRWDQPLGNNFMGLQGKPLLILLIRSELFRRYPTAIVYAAAATGTGSTLKPNYVTARYPLFRGSAEPDIAFFGFDLTKGEAVGGAQGDGKRGWFFIIQQQPGEPTFGLDLDSSNESDDQPPPIKSWSELSWRHLVRSKAELGALSHVRVAQGTPPLPDTSANPPGARWGTNAAHMARITLQQPVRIAIHANQLL
jgi:hypothetical protein